MRHELAGGDVQQPVGDSYHLARWWAVVSVEPRWGVDGLGQERARAEGVEDVADLAAAGLPVRQLVLLLLLVPLPVVGVLERLVHGTGAGQGAESLRSSFHERKRVWRAPLGPAPSPSPSG
jgi:hypothetical protein